MRTLKVLIEDSDYLRLGIEGNMISYSDLKEKINLEYARTALEKCHKIAEETGK